MNQESDSESETSVLKASIQAALYSVTDIEQFQPKRKTPKVIQRKYRLVALKPTTPEELYSRKVSSVKKKKLMPMPKRKLNSNLVIFLSDRQRRIRRGLVAGTNIQP